MLSSIVFVYTELRSANQNPRLRFSRPTLDAAPLFLCPLNSISPWFATHTSCPQIPENTITLSSFLATHTDFAPVTPVFATHTKTTGVYTNNSHSGLPRGTSKGSPSLPRASRGAAAKGTHSCPSRLLCDLSVSRLNPILSPSTLNLQLLTSLISRDLSFQPLTNCPSRNHFFFTSLQMPRGVEGSVQEFLKHYFNSGRISGRLN